MRCKIWILVAVCVILFPINVEAMHIEQTCSESFKKDIELDEETELLARLITAEAGSDWCTDELMYGVGSVVLNRVESELFPNTIEEVIYQKGQYQCASSGSINKKPCDRAKQVAINLMENGSIFPDDVVFQAEFKQGEVYKKIQNTYFCRKR